MFNPLAQFPVGPPVFEMCTRSLIRPMIFKELLFLRRRQSVFLSVRVEPGYTNHPRFLRREFRTKNDQVCVKVRTREVIPAGLVQVATAGNSQEGGQVHTPELRATGQGPADLWFWRQLSGAGAVSGAICWPPWEQPGKLHLDLLAAEGTAWGGGGMCVCGRHLLATAGTAWGKYGRHLLATAGTGENGGQGSTIYWPLQKLFGDNVGGRHLLATVGTVWGKCGGAIYWPLRKLPGAGPLLSLPGPLGPPVGSCPSRASSWVQAPSSTENKTAEENQ